MPSLLKLRVLRQIRPNKPNLQIQVTSLYTKARLAGQNIRNRMQITSHLHLVSLLRRKSPQIILVQEHLELDASSPILPIQTSSSQIRKLRPQAQDSSFLTMAGSAASVRTTISLVALTVTGARSAKI